MGDVYVCERMSQRRVDLPSNFDPKHPIFRVGVVIWAISLAPRAPAALTPVIAMVRAAREMFIAKRYARVSSVARVVSRCHQPLGCPT